MDEVKKIETIDELLAMQKKMNKKSDLRKIRRAYDYAENMHKSQRRKSGEPYIIHPLNVAYILAELALDDDTICAALLHDVIEDTPSTYDEVKKIFGEDVAVMVEGVTKLGKLKYTTKEEAQVETYRKMFLAMGKDIRVILVKIADRLHNMRTMNYMVREKQILKSKETLDVYAPLANRLGMHRFKGELEDLAFKYLMPEEYREIMIGLNKRSFERERYLENISKEIEKLLKKNKIKYVIEGRVKHMYSIYKKMQRDNSSLDKIYDVFALRILVDDIPTCYMTLGLLHDKFTPMMGRFKDYIAVPKANMYQSLHTTLIIPKEAPFEVQIRTHEMHKVAEFGIAAHWAYKEANYKGKKAVVTAKNNDKLSWVRETIEWQEQTKDPDVFMDALKTELFEDEVYVYTPKGDIKMLPKGSTTIDFAYTIHEQVGNKLVGAKINGEIVPIITKLSNGDIVTIVTSEGSKGPSKDWIKHIKMPSTKAKIIRFFKREEKEDTILKGKELLEKELKKTGIEPYEFLTPNAIADVLERYGYSKIDELYSSIGFGNLGVNKVTGKLINIYNQDHQDEALEKKMKDLEYDNKTGKTGTTSGGVYVKGIENCLIKLAKCCSPLPGDDIVGYITQNVGVSVHRTNCRNLKHLMKDPNRIIDVYWKDEIKENYAVEIEIYGINKNRLLKDIIQLIDKLKISLEAIGAGLGKTDIVQIDLRIVVKDNEELKKAILALEKIDGVIEIKRKRG